MCINPGLPFSESAPLGAAHYFLAGGLLFRPPPDGLPDLLGHPAPPLPLLVVFIVLSPCRSSWEMCLVTGVPDTRQP